MGQGVTGELLTSLCEKAPLTVIQGSERMSVGKDELKYG